MPETRELTLIIHNWTAEVNELHFGDIAIPITRKLPRKGDGAALDRKSQQLTVRVSWDHLPTSLQIN